MVLLAGLYLDESDVRGMPPSNHSGPSKHPGAPDSSAASLDRTAS